MKKHITFFLSLLIMVGLLSFSACKSGSSDSSTGGEQGSKPAVPEAANMTKTDTGLEYAVHTSSAGEKAKFGDFLTLHMQYATLSDSIIFSSFDKPKPLSFKFQKTLFKGILNDGLTKMAAGDSATFLVPADSLYGVRLPRFLSAGDKIKYTIALQKIQSQEVYQKEQEETRRKQLAKDQSVIDGYLKESGGKVETTESGLQYILGKAGTGDAPSNRAKVMAKYSMTVLNTNEKLEDTEGETKELKVQTRGLREGLGIFKKGGKGKIIVPSVLGYGDRQRGKIPPNAVLLYDLEIVDIQEPGSK